MPSCDAANAEGDTSFAPSALGTKDYWDAAYERELQNFRDHGDPGEVWFESCVKRLLSWIANSSGISRDATVLDVGCGNGVLLTQLARMGFKHLVGTDFCPQAILLASEIAQQEGLTISFQADDFLHSTLQTTFEVVLDKGTYDAISLHEERLERQKAYLHSLLGVLRPGGLFVITSCNFTAEELVAQFCGGEGAGSLEQHGRVEYPVMRFGGSTGSSVSTVSFRRL